MKSIALNLEPSKKNSGTKNPRNARLKKKPVGGKENPQVPKLDLGKIANNENISPSSARIPKAPQSTRTGRPKNPRFIPKQPITARRTNISIPTSPIIKNGPITPEDAKRDYKHMLTSYEMKEIDQFDEIFFIGILSKKNRPRAEPKNNFGFDDSGHHLKINVGEQIAYRFEVKAVLGKGSFGQVLRCFDHKLKKSVALKIIINTQQMQEQGRVEIAILQHLNEADPDNKSDIVRNIDCFLFRNHVCATYEVLGKNLFEYSRSIHFMSFNARQIRLVAKHMLTALLFIHQNGVIHCDMKPENVVFLPNSTTNCRVIDFGSSCFIGRQKFEYIQSRYYRAPEVVLGIPYGTPMDIWSFGCIIAEMMSGKPLFPAGSEPELLDMMIEVLGPPPKEMIDSACHRDHFFNSLGSLLPFKKRKRRQPNSVSLKSATRINDHQLLELVRRCLEWDPSKRITAKEALELPFFASKIAKPATPRSARGSSSQFPMWH